MRHKKNNDTMNNDIGHSASRDAPLHSVIGCQDDTEAEHGMSSQCTLTALIKSRGLNADLPMMSLPTFSAPCLRRVVALLIFCAICYVRSHDGSRVQIEQVAPKSLQAGKTLRITRTERMGKPRCRNCLKAQNSSQLLPSPNQVWSHATNSRQRLQHAMQDATITAIEADMIMGIDTTYRANSTLEPIMGHPIMGHPLRSSDLSFETFLKMCTVPSTGRSRERVLQKHIKLDFKEPKVLEPAFNVLSRLRINPNGKTIFLNADVLPKSNARIAANDFFATCFRLIHDLEQTMVSHHSAVLLTIANRTTNRVDSVHASLLKRFSSCCYTIGRCWW